MKYGNLNEITGKLVRDWYEWLDKEQQGCCSLCFAIDSKWDWAVCMGWHQVGDHEYEIAWKIGRQALNNCMQCDLDWDFEMPWDKDGEVDDTLGTVEPKCLKHGCIGYPRKGAPKGYRSWDALASYMRREARRIVRTYAECEDGDTPWIRK